MCCFIPPVADKIIREGKNRLPAVDKIFPKKAAGSSSQRAVKPTETVESDRSDAVGRAPTQSTVARRHASPAMFTVIVPPLRKARLTPEDDEPFAFALGAKIGSGAFSTVYALSAPSTSMAAKVVVKTDLAADHIEQLVQEMRVLRALHHPNIIRMHATHETDERLSIIMERASCDLLDCLHRDGLFSEVRARRLMRQLLSALEFCHTNAIIHRDVKPENLLLFGDSHAVDVVLKLADFGTVRVLDDNFGQSHQTAQHRTEQAQPRGLIEAMRAMVTSTSQRGTSYYMAPEVCYRRPYGEAVDVWSAGVVLHVLLSGEAPWGEGRTPHPKEGAGVVPPCTAAPWKSVSPELLLLLRGMLAVDASARLTAATALSAPWFTAKLAEGASETVRTWFGVASAVPEEKRTDSTSPSSVVPQEEGCCLDDAESGEQASTVRQCFAPLSCCATRKGAISKSRRHSFQPY